ncbi:MAG: NADH-quinone oxidoreductase subunit N [Acidobacteria bacterium]|nr:NADH-quinone oxidoreductase subunit N [Acidobacteriota bacterium]
MLSEYFTAIDFLLLKPAILLTIFGIGVMLTDLLLDERQKHFNAVTALVGIGFAAVQMLRIQSQMREAGVSEVEAFRGAIVLDGLGIFFIWLFLISTAITILISFRYLEIENEHHGEYYAILLFATVGMIFLAIGMDLITLFIGLELMVVSIYILAGFLRGDRRSNEAAMKYLLLGAFSSGILIYGMSLLYGMSGSTNLREIGLALSQRSLDDPMVIMAVVTIAAGLFFKIGAVPFHQWLPDVYEGAPHSVTAFMSVGPKVAAFALLLRLFLVPLGSLREQWEPLLIGVAVATMTLGNLAAISQSNIKRMLGYSAISHVGYILLGLVAGNETGLKGIAIYLLVYVFMNLGIFTVVVAMRRRDLVGDEINDMAGLMHKSPVMAILSLIFLLSLAGIPPTAGFLGKYFIFLSLLETGHYTLAVIAVLYVAVAIYYYFRIVVVMFMQPPADQELPSMSLGIRCALGVTAAMTLFMGLYPEPFIQLASGPVLAILP